MIGKGKKRENCSSFLSSLSTLGLCTGGGSGSAHVKGRIASGGGRGRRQRRWLSSWGCHAGRSSRRSVESRIAHHSPSVAIVVIATMKGLPTGDDARGARRRRI